MGLRNFVRQTARSLKEKFFGEVDAQKLLDTGKLGIVKTKAYESDDARRLDTDHPWGPPGNVMVWSYRIKFDNIGRKRRFMQAVEDYPEQFWDGWVRWYDDISNYEGEICVEAMCRVPKEEYGKFMYNFERTITRDLVVAD